MYEVNQSTENPNSSNVRKTLGSVLKFGYDAIETIVISLAIVIFSYFFIISPHEVIGPSMEENFYDGEYLLADKITYRFKDPQLGDVIIFKHSDTADYIKRVIGVPGDKVELRDGKIYINGKKIDESEYLTESYTKGGNFLEEGDVYVVPEDKYFVCGDHRSASSDSRAFGPIEKSQIKGRVLLIYWPFDKFEFVKRPEYAK
ncbi:signal peptidase I [Candidatus Dojkabacteria bacterium]|nr:signal peptidase I [Candidatus Dojkabacteria bacterium]